MAVVTKNFIKDSVEYYRFEKEIKQDNFLLLGLKFNPDCVYLCPHRNNIGLSNTALRFTTLVMRYV